MSCMVRLPFTIICLQLLRHLSMPMSSTVSQLPTFAYWSSVRQKDSVYIRTSSVDADARMPRSLLISAALISTSIMLFMVVSVLPCVRSLQEQLCCPASWTDSAGRKNSCVSFVFPVVCSPKLFLFLHAVGKDVYLGKDSLRDAMYENVAE